MLHDPDFIRSAKDTNADADRGLPKRLLIAFMILLVVPLSTVAIYYVA